MQKAQEMVLVAVFDAWKRELVKLIEGLKILF